MDNTGSYYYSNSHHHRTIISPLEGSSSLRRTAEVSASSSFRTNDQLFGSMLHSPHNQFRPLMQESPSLFAQTMREEDEKFYATFPAARQAVNHWAHDDSHGGYFQGSGFHYNSAEDTTGYAATVTAAYPASSDLCAPLSDSQFLSVVVSLGGSSESALSVASAPSDGQYDYPPSVDSPSDAYADDHSSSQPGWRTNGHTDHSPPAQLVNWPESKDTSPVEEVQSHLIVPSQRSHAEFEAEVRRRQQPIIMHTPYKTEAPYMDYLPSPSTPNSLHSPASSSSSNDMASPPLRSPEELPEGLYTASVRRPSDFGYDAPLSPGHWPTPAQIAKETLLAPAPRYPIPGVSESSDIAIKTESPEHSARRQHTLHRPFRHRAHAHAHPHPHHHPSMVKHPVRSSGWATRRSPSPRLSMRLSPLQTKRQAEKKPPLACLFCRGRKIACGPPLPGSKDKTCNQCQRRSLKCEYPLESRRGMRKKKSLVNLNPDGPKVTVTKAEPKEE